MENKYLCSCFATPKYRCKDAKQGKDAHFLGDNVAASSVTGTGPGDSNGKYKPQNNGSCGCTSPSNPATTSTIKRKKGCVISHGSASKFVQYGHSSGALKIKSCF